MRSNMSYGSIDSSSNISSTVNLRTAIKKFGHEKLVKILIKQYGEDEAKNILRKHDAHESRSWTKNTLMR